MITLTERRTRTIVLLLGDEDYDVIQGELGRRQAQKASEEWMPRSDDPEPESNPVGGFIAEAVRDLNRLRHETITPHAPPPQSDHSFPFVSASLARKQYCDDDALAADIVGYVSRIPGGAVIKTSRPISHGVLFLWRGLSFYFQPTIAGRNPPPRIAKASRLTAHVSSVADVQAVLQQASAWAPGSQH